jgi:hypothetical protein
MELIKDIADWIAAESINFVASIFPLLMLGLLGLYLLWMLVGYLRVSQVGIHDGREPRTAVALPSGEAPQLETAPGMPYCPFDRLQYPIGATFCTQCERDLVIDCTNCGATLNAGASSCYRCGTPTGVVEPARLS